MVGPNLIAVNVGNSRTHVGQFAEGQLQQSTRFGNRKPAAAVQRVLNWWEPISGMPQAAILVASVNDKVADRVRAMISDQLSVEVYSVGNDVPVPITSRLDPETITGVDRLLNAAAAYDRTREACVVIDAGTALTIDFVDNEGVFHGGAIVAGATIQLQALHEYTSLLPELDLAKPDEDAFGRSTSQAMLKGVYHGIRGTVQRFVELYAAASGAFPRVIATGGDAPLLFEGEELIDTIVPDLTLLGIAAAARHALAGDRSEGPDG